MRKSNVHKRTASLGWDELRTVLEVVRHGSLNGAARALDLQHSSVFRRLATLERRIGAALFERERGRYLPNARGEALAEAARTMEAAALAAEHGVLDQDAQLAGRIRLSSSELLTCFLLAALLPRFRAEHPAIELELDVTNRQVDLARREADLALRATRQPPEHLVGRKLGEIGYAIYAHRSLLPRVRAGASLDLAAQPWLGFDERLASFPNALWLREKLPEVKPMLRFDSLLAMQRAAAEGAGFAVLPTFGAAQEPRLMRVGGLLPITPMPVWLLSHPDIRHNARMRALSAYLVETVPPHLAVLREQGVCSGCTGVVARKRGRPRRESAPAPA